jgi:hypothetical protein
VPKEDYTREAGALFVRFAERHGLSYEVETGVPMELCWTFPAQEKLSLDVTLGLQNGDELNFGVSNFWSYFFPFEEIAAEFERLLDAWVTGEARIAITGPWGRVLQLREGGRWKSVYGANRILPVWREPKQTFQNRPLPDS